MIRFTCDRCDMEIELDDSLSGTKHECIGCGDINRVPEIAHESTIDDPTDPEPIDTKKIDRAAEAGFPPDFGPEQRVLITRRCWFRSRAIRFSILMLTSLLSFVGILWALIYDKSWMWHLLFVPVLLGGIGIISWWWIDRLSASLEITTKRTIMHHGILSKSSSEVVHDNIRNILIDK